MGRGDSLSGVAREEGATKVTIRRDLKEVREQVPRGRRHLPGPEAGAGGPGSSGENRAASVRGRVCGRGQTGPGCTATDLDAGLPSRVTCHLGPAEDGECFLFGGRFPLAGLGAECGHPLPVLRSAVHCRSGTSVVHDLEVWYIFKGNKSGLLEKIFSPMPPRALSWQVTRQAISLDRAAPGVHPAPRPRPRALH